MGARHIGEALLAALALGLLSACGSVQVTDTPGKPAVLCAPGADLGRLAVIPVTHWRPDQKEPPRREAIAEAAIKDAFASVKCARSVDIRPIAADGETDARLTEAKAAGADTAVVIKLEELGPILIISAPVLVSGWSDIKFSLREVDLKSGQNRLEVERHRKVGGAWEVRGLWPLHDEFVIALKGLIGG